MNVSLYLARKLSLSSKGKGRSPALGVSIAAVALSLAVMTAAVSVALGFKREIRQKVYGFNSHITLYDGTGENDNLISLSPSLKGILEDEGYVESYSLEVSIPAIFKTPDDFKGIYLRSVSPQSTQYRFLSDNITEGFVPDFSVDTMSDNVVVSRKAALQLGLHAGDKIDTYFLNDNLKVRRLKIAGIYDSHFDSYDDVLAFTSLSQIQSVAGLTPSQGTSIQISVGDPERIGEYTGLLAERLVKAVAEGEVYRYYRVDNALSQGASYFNWLALLDTNVAVILTLMALVAIATLISGLMILVMDKQRFILIVRTLGMQASTTGKVFVWLALRIALIGMGVGNCIVLFLLWLQYRFHFIHLDPDAYYIDFVPVEFNWTAFAILNVSAFVLIYLALLLPARIAAKKQV